MSTQCIKVSMKEPLEVLKGCSAILCSLDSGYSENIYSHHGISIIADLIADAVSILDEERLVQISLYSSTRFTPSLPLF